MEPAFNVLGSVVGPPEEMRDSMRLRTAASGIWQTSTIASAFLAGIVYAVTSHLLPRAVMRPF